MRPPHDLMERLTAADPAPGAEPLGPDERRDADALLERLLAAPVERERSGARPRRRWVQLGVATACAAVVVFAALSLLDSDDSPAPHVLDKAIAALTQKDAIYHLEAIATATTPGMPKDNRSLFFESWHTTSGLVHRKAWLLRNGRKSPRYDDFAGQRRPGRRGGPALRYDPLTNTIMESGFGVSPGGRGAPGVDPFDPSRGLRELQAEGRLRVSGRVAVDGRPAYRLISGPLPGANGSVERVEFLVDAETYLPREQSYSVRSENGATMKAVWRYLTYERLPLNDETRKLLDLDPHPGAKCSPYAGKMTGKRDPGFPNPCAR